MKLYTFYTYTYILSKLTYSYLINKLYFFILYICTISMNYYKIEHYCVNLLIQYPYIHTFMTT